MRSSIRNFIRVPNHRPRAVGIAARITWRSKDELTSCSIICIDLADRAVGSAACAAAMLHTTAMDGESKGFARRVSPLLTLSITIQVQLDLDTTHRTGRQAVASLAHSLVQLPALSST